MASMNFTLKCKIEALRVNPELYELMLISDIDAVTHTNNGLFFNEIPVIADKSINDIDVDFDVEVVEAGL